MKRLVAVISGLIALPAFAEVAPDFYYADAVEYTDELPAEYDAEFAEEVAEIADDGDAVATSDVDMPVKKSVQPSQISPRGTSTSGRVATQRGSASTTATRATAAGGRVSASGGRTVTARGTTATSRNTTARSTTARPATNATARTTTARTATARVSTRPSTTAARSGTIARSATTAARTATTPTTRSAATSTGTGTAARSALVQTDTVNNPLYIGRVGVRGTTASARTPTIRMASGTTSTTTTVTDTNAETTSAMDDLAEMTDYCKAQYTACMDNFCNVLDDNQGRCSCSANLDQYADTETALKQATADLQDVAQKIQYIGLTAAEVETLFTQTAAELQMQSSSDNSQIKNDLDKIKDLIVDVQTGNATSTETGFNFDLSGLLDFTISSTGFDLSSLLGGGSASSISNQRGAQLYKTATARCKTSVLNACKNQGVDTALITNAYDMEIDKQCIAYERALTVSNDEMATTVRNAKSVLQKARLLVAQQKNTYDLRGCITALDSCMQDDYVCGDDYENCLDPTGKYIVNGEIVVGSEPGISGMLNGALYDTWDYGTDYNAWSEVDAGGNVADFIDQTIGERAFGHTPANISELLQQKIGYHDDEDGKNHGMCISVLNKCQNVTYNGTGQNLEYNYSNNVVREYLQRIMIQIKSQQDELLAEYAEECISDVTACLTQNGYDVEKDKAGTSAQSTIAKNACNALIKTCMSVNNNSKPTPGNITNWVNMILGNSDAPTDDTPSGLADGSSINNASTRLAVAREMLQNSAAYVDTRNLQLSYTSLNNVISRNDVYAVQLTTALNVLNQRIKDIQCADNYHKDGEKCTSNCPSDSEISGKTCICNDSEKYYNTHLMTCEICPENSEKSGNTCKCTQNYFTFDMKLATCTTKVKCPDGATGNYPDCNCGNLRDFDDMSIMCKDTTELINATDVTARTSAILTENADTNIYTTQFGETMMTNLNNLYTELHEYIISPTANVTKEQVRKLTNQIKNILDKINSSCDEGQEWYNGKCVAKCTGATSGTRDENGACVCKAHTTLDGGNCECWGTYDFNEETKLCIESVSLKLARKIEQEAKQPQVGYMLDYPLVSRYMNDEMLTQLAAKSVTNANTLNALTGNDRSEAQLLQSAGNAIRAAGKFWVALGNKITSDEALINGDLPAEQMQSVTNALNTLNGVVNKTGNGNSVLTEILDAVTNINRAIYVANDFFDSNNAGTPAICATDQTYNTELKKCVYACTGATTGTYNTDGTCKCKANAVLSGSNCTCKPLYDHNTSTNTCVVSAEYTLATQVYNISSISENEILARRYPSLNNYSLVYEIDEQSLTLADLYAPQNTTTTKTQLANATRELAITLAEYWTYVSGLIVMDEELNSNTATNTVSRKLDDLYQPLALASNTPASYTTQQLYDMIKPVRDYIQNTMINYIPTCPTGQELYNNKCVAKCTGVTTGNRNTDGTCACKANAVLSGSNCTCKPLYDHNTSTNTCAVSAEYTMATQVNYLAEQTNQDIVDSLSARYPQVISSPLVETMSMKQSNLQDLYAPQNTTATKTQVANATRELEVVLGEYWDYVARTMFMDEELNSNETIKTVIQAMETEGMLPDLEAAIQSPTSFTAQEFLTRIYQVRNYIMNSVLQYL